MRRRTIIAIIITALVVFLTNKVWLNFKPMTVDFDISGRGICNIEVQLNKENNDKFEKIKSLGKKINLDKNQHAHFSIERAKFPKRLRLVFKNLDSTVEIKNITLKNKKYKLDDLNAFGINAGELALNQDTIQITPPQTENSIILTYNKPLKIRTSVKFDIKIFLIIMILTFLLAYKLTDYVANFSTIKNESRIEIIFLTIFFIFLFIPMIHINQNDISINENRYLANWKPLINKEGKINFNFGKNYNTWFNDRFNLRQYFLDINTYITLLLTKKAKKGIIDKNGFIYMNFEANHYYLLKQIDEKDYDTLIKFNNYLKDKNIELYVLLVPCKGYVYPPTEKILVNDNYDKLIEERVNSLNKNSNMHIINLQNKLKEESKNKYMYYKTDHHWTDDGAFIGYQELMKEITKKHPDIKILKDEDFDIFYNTKVRGDWGRDFLWGQSTRRTNIPLNYKKKLHKTEYRYYKHKNSNLLQTKVIHTPRKRVKYYYFPKGSDYRVILLGTSMSESLCEFIPYTFKNVFRLRNNNVKNISENEEFKIMKYYKKTILDYHPDIIIFCISDDNIRHLKNIFSMS